MQLFNELGHLLVNTGGITSVPATSTDNAIARWDGVSGRNLQNSGILIDDSDNITGIGNLTLAEYIYHTGDLDTYIRFTDDRIRVLVGNVDMLDITEAGTDTVVWNEGGVDVDFRWEGVGAPNAFFIQGSNGKVGLGTSTVPHGGRGAAMLALEGAQSWATGPFIQITSATDDYPLFAIMAYSHNQIALKFDCHQSTAGQDRSSDAGSNFDIGKVLDTIRFRYDSGIAQGGVITWNDGIVLDVAGIVGIPAKLGLGTTTVPHGGVGAAMLALDGADGSEAAGPHVQITTSADDYPLLHMYMSTHDSINFGWDAYLEGGWKSSDTGSNFLINKSGDLMKWQYDSGVAQGGAIGWNIGFALAVDGGIFFNNLLQQTAVGLVVEYNAGTGEIYAETSAKRFKKNIRPLEVDT